MVVLASKKKKKKSGNQHHILLTRCFREELKQRIWGKRSVWEGPIGSCSFLLLQVTFVLIKGVCWFLCFINQKSIGLTKMFVLFGFCVKYFREPNTKAQGEAEGLNCASNLVPASLCLTHGFTVVLY